MRWVSNNQRKLGSNTSELRMIFTWWRVVCDFTLHNNTSEKNWPWWRVVWDFTRHNNTSEKNWPWWRVVCDFTRHNNTSQKNNRLWHRVVTKGSGDFGKWWGTEVVRKGSGDEGKWWWRECCETHCNGCMNVAWALFWGGSRSTKPCIFFNVKWLQAAMEGTSCVRPVRLRSFWFLLCVLQRVVVPVCVLLCVSWICGYVFCNVFLCA